MVHFQTFATVSENHIKVSFSIASEASYVYKFSKNAKNIFFFIFENLKLVVKKCCQTGYFYRTEQDKNWWKMPKLKKKLNETF